MFADIFEDIFQPMFSDLFGLSKVCQAIRFNGVNNYGQLAQRAIDPDGDIDIEWYQIGELKADGNVIVAQCGSGANSTQEFRLTARSDSVIELIVGGSVNILLNSSQGFEQVAKYRVRLINTTLEIFKNDVLLRSVSFTRGVVREPSANALIGVRLSGGSFANYFQGVLAWIRINNFYYAMDAVGQAIQLPTPSGLGEELITQQVLENPAAKGSQWTYLGAGRWQYVGDGTFNALRFIEASPQPASGFLEFEVESISGVMRCAESANSNPVNPRFSSTGVFRYYYTSKANAGGSTGNTMIFVRDSGVASCIIKNISFKPLGTSNPMTLFNTVPEQWEEISCGLRPSEDELLTPTITSEPQDQSVLVGETASFTVAAEVELGAVEFQWQADSGAGFVDIPTETSATLSLPLVALIDNGKLVRARVSANGRSAVSRAALLTVGEPI